LKCLITSRCQVIFAVRWNNTMLIPVFCDAHKCGTIWFDQSIFGGPGTIVVEQCKAGPCPSCGSFGTIPDGTYNPVSGFINKIGDWQRIAFALMAIRDAIADGSNINDIKKKIAADPVAAFALRNFVPKDLKELQTLFIIIGMFLAACKVFVSDTPPLRALLPKSVVDMISDVANEPRKEIHTAPTPDTPPASTDTPPSDSGP
jgi:hypothetical protein